MAMLTKHTSIEAYVQQWLATIGPHLDVVFAWGTGVDPFQRMQIRCKKCNQTLTGDAPESAEKMDWAVQKFASTHSHKQASGLTAANEGTIGIDATIPKVLQDQITRESKTVDFKSVPKPLRRKDGRRFREDN